MAEVLLAMSGGVDSSVAALLLQEQGHVVTGVFMRHGESSPVSCQGDGQQLPIVGAAPAHKQGCCSAADAHDARRVADMLGIPFYALNLQREFDAIIDYFVDEYTSGRTPNPCIACNNWLKFGKLFDYADSIGAQYVATGHYAQLNRNADNQVELYRGVDRTKDQSYVLFGIERSRFPRMLLPVGQHTKLSIRRRALRLGHAVAEKPDSQEICFVTAGHHSDFVAARRSAGDNSGQIVTADGRVVGMHDGIERFTIGQRKGLGVAMGEPYFVVRIEAETKRVVIGRKEALARHELHAGNINWLVDEREGTFRCQAQIRYNSAPVDASATMKDGGRLGVVFDEPCFGVAPGQAVVCYDQEQVLCGGWIE